MLPDVFENFWNMCLEIYKLGTAWFITAPGLTWKAALKKNKIKWYLLIDIDMLLMVEKDIRGGILTLFINMQKLIINTWKNIIKIKNRYILNNDM